MGGLTCLREIAINKEREKKDSASERQPRRLKEGLKSLEKREPIQNEFRVNWDKRKKAKRQL